MDDIQRKLLIVTENGKYKSLISIGDIQRAIISNIDLSQPIKKILNSDVKIVARETDSIDSIKTLMRKLRCEFMPVLSKENNITKVIFWEDILGEEDKLKNVNLSIPVVIMAGGKGSRLKPITNVLPKPLIPIGTKPIIEEIMSRFLNVGCDEFYISVNYKADMIRHYFEKECTQKFNIHFFQENKPLGTGGSLHLIKHKINTTFFVSNCDIIIEQDLDEIYNYHKKNQNKITIISALKHYKIPYGTIETGENGLLKNFSEKPELTFQINSGLYILEPDVLNLIPEDQFFHITHLIEKLTKSGGKVGVFPVSENSWKDIGEWPEYLKLIEHQL